MLDDRVARRNEVQDVVTVERRRNRNQTNRPRKIVRPIGSFAAKGRKAVVSQQTNKTTAQCQKNSMMIPVYITPHHSLPLVQMQDALGHLDERVAGKERNLARELLRGQGRRRRRFVHRGLLAGTLR